MQIQIFSLLGDNPEYQRYLLPILFLLSCVCASYALDVFAAFYRVQDCQYITKDSSVTIKGLLSETEISIMPETIAHSFVYSTSPKVSLVFSLLSSTFPL